MIIPALASAPNQAQKPIWKPNQARHNQLGKAKRSIATKNMKIETIGFASDATVSKRPMKYG